MLKRIVGLSLIIFPMILTLLYIGFLVLLMVAPKTINVQRLENLLEKNLLIANKDLDARDSINSLGLSKDEQWRLLYAKPLVPKLDTPLSSQEKTLCDAIISFENDRSTLPLGMGSLTVNGVSALLPFRVVKGLFSGRGSSTALQSAIGSVLEPSSKIEEIQLTTAISKLPETTKCRLINASMKASITKNNHPFQQVSGGYAMAEVLFNKPLNNLDNCELSYMATAFRYPLSALSKNQNSNEFVYNYHIDQQGLRQCPKFETYENNLNQLSIDNHPITKYLKFKDLPNNIDLDNFINFQKNVIEASKELNQTLGKQLVVEVAIMYDKAITRIDSLNRSQGFGSQYSAGSLAKLVIANRALENGISTHDQDINRLFCQSDKLSALRLLDKNIQYLEKDIKKFHLESKLPIQQTLTTEDNGWSSNDILLFAESLVNNLKSKPKVLNAFSGNECTASSLRPVIQPRYVLFGKTGTASRLGVTTSKLLLFSVKVKNDDYANILIRIEGETNVYGICSGESCIKNSDLFIPFLKPIFGYLDKIETFAQTSDHLSPPISKSTKNWN